MKKEHWQGAAFVLAGLWAMTMAAAFVTKRELAATTQRLIVEEGKRCDVPEEPEMVTYSAPAPAAAIETPDTALNSNGQPFATPLPEPEVYDDTPPAPDSKCIGGQRFDKIAGGWQQAGAC